jgi:hypothetical protein
MKKSLEFIVLTLNSSVFMIPVQTTEKLIKINTEIIFSAQIKS